jgi:DNA repair protein RecN (Recombination protein N)
MADHHFVIVKSSDGGSTTTDIRLTDEEGSVAEIARLLGSDSLSESSLSNARDLKSKANESKKSI